MKVPRSTIAILCPPCAEEMARRGWTYLDTRAMPAGMMDALCEKMGSDDGFFARCLETSFGDFDSGDQESFCAWLHNECVGKWPSGMSASPEEAAIRLTRGGVEHRDWTTELRFDAVSAPGAETAPVIRGHAAVFESLSEDLGGFREKIAPGAFRKTLSDGADVRALVNHDPAYVLGRTRSGTLRLAEDLRGLAIEVEAPPTTWARDLEVSMRRGDVTQMSFGFRAIRDSWGRDEAGPVRTLREVALVDVSVVTFPAYGETNAAVRALAELGLDTPRRGVLHLGARFLAQFPTAPRAPDQEIRPSAPSGDARVSRVDLLRRRLDLAGMGATLISEVGSEETARAPCASGREDQGGPCDPRQGGVREAG